MSLKECNTKTQRHEGTKNEDEISHQSLIDFFVSLSLRVFVFNLLMSKQIETFGHRQRG